MLDQMFIQLHKKKNAKLSERITHLGGVKYIFSFKRVQINFWCLLCNWKLFRNWNDRRLYSLNITEWSVCTTVPRMPLNPPRKNPIKFFRKGILFSPISVLDSTGTIVHYKSHVPSIWDASIFAFRRLRLSPEYVRADGAGVESVKMRGKSSSYIRPRPCPPHASEWVYR